MMGPLLDRVRGILVMAAFGGVIDIRVAAELGKGNSSSDVVPVLSAEPGDLRAWWHGKRAT